MKWRLWLWCVKCREWHVHFESPFAERAQVTRRRLQRMAVATALERVPLTEPWELPDQRMLEARGLISRN